jgi:hypothetical protein
LIRTDADIHGTRRSPGLDPARRYRVTDVTPGEQRPRFSGLAGTRLSGFEVSGAALAEVGVIIAAQRTLSALVILVDAL